MRTIGQVQVLFAPEGQSGGGEASGAGTASPAPSGTSGSGTVTPSSSQPSGASSSSAGTGTVASPPSPPTETVPADQTAAPDWSFDDVDFETGVVSVAEVVPPVAATPTQATPPTTAQPVAAEAKPAETVVPPVAAQPPGPKEASPPLLSSEPGELARQLMANESAILDAYSREQFALSPEEVEALETDVVGTVPKLMAKAALRAQVASLNFMAKQIPAMIERHLSVTKANAGNEDKFYTRWKDLGIDKASHHALVQKYGSLYRQANPAASMDQMIEDLGPVIVMAAKIPPRMPVVGQVNGTGAPQVRPPQPSPFVPAMSGPAAIPGTEDLNPWSVNPGDD